ncbi:flagellar biosynthesis protein FlhA [Salipiger mucosus]|uniref:Flagellar biosynthesis protein FlhA n=1 Tax=Salipiger mucosus DSM 16094 TaxID=1123237 RepID=S9QDK9_9RHOB|nr:flagellar biosynthesis protein FlhA [Salipiger mucosus]EPX78002.1 Flagellar biosynthesis protein FlhA [Salipiger mucosus DSM 16094]
MTTGPDIGQKGKLAALGTSNKDIGFALGIVLVLAVLFIPLPKMLLDFGLAISLTVSILVLMVALWIRKPLEFDAFPTLLLVVTMLRLSLNVASTRLILSEGNTGTSAAGDIIEGFSQVIVGGDYVIGVVIFTILVVINFMVITKGATRIAEVSARFTLDAIPGKQMAIDADLGSGAIDDAEARRRRDELNEESSFMGAMDGASKFVRGDAIAGIIITLINVVGGIIIGVMQHDMTVASAANNYTVLTIGDGLVSQIPALVVSLAAGLIVTKGGREGAANEAIFDQLGKYPRAMFMASGLILLLGLLPGFPFVLFLVLSGALIALGVFVQKETQRKAREKAAQEAEEKDPNVSYSEEAPEQILRLDDMRLELGGGLVPMISSMDAALPGNVRSLRNLFAEEFGFILPPIRIVDNAEMEGNSYTISLQGSKVAEGDIRPNAMMVIDPANGKINLKGEKTREPTFNLNAMWIDPNLAEEAEQQGYTVVDPESVITTHLTETIKEHMPSLMTYGAARELVENLDREYQKLLSEMNQQAPTVMLQRVLQNLLAERVSVRNLPLIVESLTEAASQSSNLASITEHVRQKLSNQICQSLVDSSGFLPVVVMSDAWENEFVQSVRQNGDDTDFVMAPARVQEFVLDAKKVLEVFAQRDEWPAVMVTPQVRVFVRSMLERVSPQTAVISHNEVHRKTPIKTVATISSE